MSRLMARNYRQHWSAGNSRASHVAARVGTWISMQVLIRRVNSVKFIILEKQADTFMYISRTLYCSKTTVSLREKPSEAPCHNFRALWLTVGVVFLVCSFYCVSWIPVWRCHSWRTWAWTWPGQTLFPARMKCLPHCPVWLLRALIRFVYRNQVYAW